jgi:DNA-binding transcriptional MerR regulator
MDFTRAFTADRVLQLTGLSKRQLQHWEQTGLIRPSLSRPDARGRGRPRLYDFRDLVELQTVAELLRHGLTLQLIRKVRDHLRRLDYEKPLAELSFEVADGELYFAEAKTIRQGRRPEQVLMQITVQLRSIVDQLHTQIAELDQRRVGEIERRRGVLGGKPLISGTRIPVALVQQLVREGLDVQGIQELYPDLTGEDIRAALAAPTASSRPAAAAQ